MAIDELRELKTKFNEAKRQHQQKMQGAIDELGSALSRRITAHLNEQAYDLAYIPIRIDEKPGEKRTLVLQHISRFAGPSTDLGQLSKDLIQNDRITDYELITPEFEFPAGASNSSLKGLFVKGKNRVIQEHKKEAIELAKHLTSDLFALKRHWQNRNYDVLKTHAQVNPLHKALAQISNSPDASSKRAQILKQLYQIYVPNFEETLAIRRARFEKPKSNRYKYVQELHFPISADPTAEKIRIKEIAKQYPQLAKLFRINSNIPVDRLKQYVSKKNGTTLFGDIQRTENAIREGVPVDFAMSHYLTTIGKSDPLSAWKLKQYDLSDVVLAQQLCKRPAAALTLLQKADKIKEHLPPSSTMPLAITIARVLGRNEPTKENVTDVINGEKTLALLDILQLIPNPEQHLASIHEHQVFTRKKVPQIQRKGTRVHLPKTRETDLHNQIKWPDEVKRELVNQPFNSAELAKALIYGFNLANRKATAVGGAYFRAQKLKKNIFNAIGYDGLKYDAIIHFLDVHGMLNIHKQWTGSEAPLSLSLNESGKSEVGKAIAGEVKRFMYEVRR